MCLPVFNFLVRLCLVWILLTHGMMAASKEEVPLALPSPPGPYSLGVKCIEFQDTSRTMLRDSTPKRWMGSLFYPSKPHHGLYPYQPFTLQNGEIQGRRILAHAKPNGIPFGGTYPLILFIPGRGADRDRYTIFAEALASSGAIVLMLDQPYVAGLVRFGSGEIIRPTLKDLWMIPRNRDFRYAYDDAVIKDTLYDLSYVVNHVRDILKALPEMDVSKIILAGHSIGANSAHIFGFRDPRVHAVIDLDSKITDRAVFGRLGVPPNPRGIPVLFIRGMMQYQDDVGDQLEHIKNATLWKPYVEHDAFSDNVFLAHHMPHFGKQSLWENVWTLFFTEQPFFIRKDTSTGLYECNEWIHLYRRTILTWLKRNRLI